MIKINKILRYHRGYSVCGMGCERPWHEPCSGEWSLVRRKQLGGALNRVGSQTCPHHQWPSSDNSLLEKGGQSQKGPEWACL